MEYIETTYRQGEWADEFSRVVGLKDDGEDVEIWFTPDAKVERKEADEVSIVWAGAVDFDGSIEDAIEAYPELVEYLS